MLYTIAVILFILWLLGLVTTHVMVGFVHLLLIGAVIVLLFAAFRAGVHRSKSGRNRKPAKCLRAFAVPKSAVSVSKHMTNRFQWNIV